MPHTVDIITKSDQTRDYVSFRLCFQTTSTLSKSSRARPRHIQQRAHRLRDLQNPAVGTVLSNRPRYHGSVQSHHKLLEHSRAAIQAMAADPQILGAATPILFHPRLETRKNFVAEDDPTTITVITDWQSADVQPTFNYTTYKPDFAHLMPDPTRNDEQIEVIIEACAMTYEVATRFRFPKLYKARSINENLFQPFRYCHRTWKDGAISFRQDMIQTSRH